MSKEIIKKEKNEISEKITEEKLRKYVKTFLTHENLNENEIEQFIEVARSQKLDPFKKELHVVAYGYGNDRTLSLITGYEVYLRRADLIPAYDFFKTEYLGELGKPDFRCEIKIYRKDRTRPLVHECYFDEFVGKKKDGTLTKFWKKMPHFMIKKVTVSQGLRWAFPNDFENMPYIKEEIENEIIDITPEKEKNQQLLKKVKENMDLAKVSELEIKEFEKEIIQKNIVSPKDWDMKTKEEKEDEKIIDVTGTELDRDGNKKYPEKNEDGSELNEMSKITIDGFKKMKEIANDEKFNGKIHTVDELFPDEKEESKDSNFNSYIAWRAIFDNDRAKNLKDSMNKKDKKYFFDLACLGPENYKEKNYKEDLKTIELYEKRTYEKGRK